MVISRNLDPAFASTEDIMAAAGIARRTVTVWVEMGLLPQPQRVSLGMPGGMFNRFPASAVERAQFIAAMLDERDAQAARSANKTRSSAPAAAKKPRARGDGRR